VFIFLLLTDNKHCHVFIFLLLTDSWLDDSYLSRPLLFQGIVQRRAFQKRSLERCARCLWRLALPCLLSPASAARVSTDSARTALDPLGTGVVVMAARIVYRWINKVSVSSRVQIHWNTSTPQTCCFRQARAGCGFCLHHHNILHLIKVFRTKNENASLINSKAS